VGDERVLVAAPAVAGSREIRGEGRAENPERPVGRNGDVLPGGRAAPSAESCVAEDGVDDQETVGIVGPQPEGHLTRSVEDIAARDKPPPALHRLVCDRGLLPHLMCRSELDLGKSSDIARAEA